MPAGDAPRRTRKVGKATEKEGVEKLPTKDLAAQSLTAPSTDMPGREADHAEVSIDHLKALGAKLDEILRALAVVPSSVKAENSETPPERAKRDPKEANDLPVAEVPQSVLEWFQRLNGQLEYTIRTLLSLQKGGETKKPLVAAASREAIQEKQTDVKAVVDQSLQVHLSAFYRNLAAELNINAVQHSLTATERDLHEVRLLLERQLIIALDDGKRLRQENEQLRSTVARLDENMKQLYSTASRAQSELRTLQDETKRTRENEREQARQDLRAAWQRIETIDETLRRGIQATGDRKWSKLRTDVLNSAVQFLEAQGCEVQLLREALDFSSLPYDGALYRWHHASGDPVLSGTPATVLLPGWFLDGLGEKPVLGKLGSE